MEKPSWNDTVHQSAEVKTLWSFWSRLQIRDGLLQRKFVCLEQQTEYWQVVMPKVYRQEFIDLVHSGPVGGHFDLRKPPPRSNREPTGRLGLATSRSTSSDVTFVLNTIVGRYRIKPLFRLH